jgi:Chaperone of endosialidase
VVNGTAAKTGGGTWSVLSDVRLKDLSGNYIKGLNEILSLQPVRIFYKKGNPRELASDEEQIGFIAQGVLNVFPEAVNQCKEGYLDFNMHPVIVAMVNATKELNTKINKLEDENNHLKAENEKINARLFKLETLMNLRAEK